MYISRTVEKKILELQKQYPIITITGPRQSGKTTLCLNLFKDKKYVSFEDIENIHIFKLDPKGFLENYSDGAIFDEVQRVPEIFSYLQTIVDLKGKNGLFILTGSQQFELLSKITQSLAGRVAIVRLLPFSFREAYTNSMDISIEEVVYTGFYPRIFKEKLNPTQMYSFYVSTYLERDVRQLVNVKDISLFEIFLKICAGRTGQILNYSAISNECGVDIKTVKKWLSVLEASYIIKILRPYYRKLNKRLIKAPKLYFLDTGLICYLLGIKTPEQVRFHPLFGNIFESFVFSEIVKCYYNSIEELNLYFYRDYKGNEVDLVVDEVINLSLIEIKSAKTVNKEFFKNFEYFMKEGYNIKNSALIYGGDENKKIKDYQIISWKYIEEFIKSLLLSA